MTPISFNCINLYDEASRNYEVTIPIQFSEPFLSIVSTRRGTEYIDSSNFLIFVTFIHFGQYISPYQIPQDFLRCCISYRCQTQSYLYISLCLHFSALYYRKQISTQAVYFPKAHYHINFRIQH